MVAPVAVPSQDMVLGIYYLTQERPGSLGEGKIIQERERGNYMHTKTEILTLHAKIKVRRFGINKDGVEENPEYY